MVFYYDTFILIKQFAITYSVKTLIQMTVILVYDILYHNAPSFFYKKEKNK